MSWSPAGTVPRSIRRPGRLRALVVATVLAGGAAGLLLLATRCCRAIPGSDLAGVLAAVAGAGAAVLGATQCLLLLVDVTRVHRGAASRRAPTTRHGRRRLRVAAALLGTGLGSSALAAQAAPAPAPAQLVTSAPASAHRSLGPVSPEPARVDHHAPAHAAADRVDARGTATHDVPVDPDPVRAPVPSTAPPSGTAPPLPDPPRRATSHAPEPGTHVVLRGESLWGIARASLPPGSSDAQVARACAAWHRANRQLIGADPDLIRPGQVLHAPATGPGAG